MEITEKIRRLEAVIFDLDGTLYLGDEAIPGAVDTVQALRRRGLGVQFISNKPLEPGAAYAKKLSSLGLPVQPQEVLTSAAVLGAHLLRTDPNLRIYVVGEENLKTELRSLGLQVLGELEDQDPKDVIKVEGIDAIVVAFDRTLDYRKLNTAYQALVRGARYFATNADRTCPMPFGAVPDAGATLAFLEHITGRKPELIAGKPSSLILEAVCERLNVSPDRCLMVGDRLETDIRMGREAGMLTALVLTGVTQREDLQACDHPPDLVLDSVEDLLTLLC